MAEELLNENIEGTASGLPSDNSGEFIGFSEQFLQDNVKNGKLFGRYSSAEEFVNYAKSQEAAAGRLGNELKTIRDGSQSEAQAQEAARMKEQAISSLVPDVIGSNMSITDEIANKAKEAGIDITELKLRAYEGKERINSAAKIVGGEEEYMAMTAWARNNLSEAQRAAFNNDLHGAMSEFAVAGLYAKYSESKQAQQTSQPEVQERISGDAPLGLSGYKSLQELYADRNYVRNNPHDKVAKQRHDARVAKTPSSMWGM